MLTKLVIRYNKLVIKTLELEPGIYELGRAIDCTIHINHPSLHRRHGKMTYENDKWIYQDYTSQKITVMDENPIELSNEIDIATELFTQDEKTDDTAKILFAFRKGRQTRIFYGFMAAIALVTGVLCIYTWMRTQMRHTDPNGLLSQVRGQIVEFEKIRNPQAIKEYENLGQFKDEDFRDRFGFCTGFLVAPNVILTASHCLWGSDFLDIQTDFEVRANNDKTFKPKRVLGFDPVRDYLFLEVEGMESYGFLEFATDYQVGQTVYTLGNAHGQGIAIREGIMASETADVNDPSIRYIRYSAGASPGNSGGPLLDINGRIVALVFAATGAENYNLGTSSKDLKIGFERFIGKTAPQQITVFVRKLFNFNPYTFVQKQILPYLPEYNEYPELTEKVSNIQLNFTVPMSFEELPEKILTEVQTKSLLAVLDIEKDLKAKHELILDWESFVSPKIPVIMVSQFDSSQNNFFLWEKRFYMKLSGFLDSPSRKDFKNYVEQFEKEKKFDFQAYGMNTDIVAPDKPGGEIYYIPRDANKMKKNIEDLAQGSLYSQHWLKTKVDDPKLLAHFFEKYLGEEGVISSTYSAFVRPQSFKNFTIRAINNPPDKLSVKDGKGRQWQRFHVKMFDQVHIYVYCMPFPEGSTCVGRMMPVENEYRLSLLEANFREHILAHFLENPYFWKPQALAEFSATEAAKSLSSLKGIKFKKQGEGYVLTLEGFKIDLNLPSDMQSVRLQTGLYLAKSAEAPKWTGFGAEWVQPGTQPQVCGLGVEPLGSQSIFILNFLRDALKRSKLKDDASNPEEIPKLWTEHITSSTGEALQLYGYCAPLRDNPMEIGYYFVDFKRAKPRQGTFKIK